MSADPAALGEVRREWERRDDEEVRGLVIE